MTRRLIAAILLLLFGPLLLSVAEVAADGQQWWQARRDSSGQAPDPATTKEAVVQIYAARTWGWRGAFAVHSWVTVKPSNATKYTRYEVMGWGVQGGAQVDALIERIKAAVESYPYPRAYTMWPGPNSNTFTAHVGREVPELRLSLPSTAIGKDFLPNGSLVALSPSGTGAQLSLFGLFGVMAGWDDGLEVNILGLTLGIDPLGMAVKLPGLGRVGASRTPT
jgi:hypothetical protein